MRVQLGGYVTDSESAAIYRRWGFRGVCCPDDIRNALKNAPAGEELIFEINSGGGSVYAGFEMYNLLRGAERETIGEIQSIAGSAASVLSMGCTTLRISPVANIMIHRSACRTVGNSETHQQSKQMLDTIDESILEAYDQRTGEKSSRDELRSLMENETFLTAQEALDKGLVDEIMFQQDGQAMAKAAVAMASGMPYIVASLPPIDELMRREQEGAQGDGKPQNAGGAGDITGEPENEKEEHKMPMTLDELTRDNPELLAEIRSTAAAAERERLSAIDDMSMAGFEDLIAAAKEDPEATAESVAVQIVARQKKQGKKFLNDREEDIKGSKADQVEATTPAGGDNDEDELEAALNDVFPEN